MGLECLVRLAMKARLTRHGVSMVIMQLDVIVSCVFSSRPSLDYVVSIHMVVISF